MVDPFDCPTPWKTSSLTYLPQLSAQFLVLFLFLLHLEKKPEMAMEMQTKANENPNTSIIEQFHLLYLLFVTCVI